MEFPARVWTLLQVQFLLVVVIFGFANMYVKNGGIRYQGAPTMVEQADHTADGSSSSRVDPGPLVNRIDALYYSGGHAQHGRVRRLHPDIERSTPARDMATWNRDADAAG